MMTYQQFEMLQDLWEEGYSLAYIRQATGIDQATLDKWHTMWYDFSRPLEPRWQDFQQ